MYPPDARAHKRENHPYIPELEGNEGPLQELALQITWRQPCSLRSPLGAVPGISHGYGGETRGEDHRQEGRIRQLLQSELPMGNRRDTSQQIGRASYRERG